MTEISLQIWQYNSSECFLSKSLAICLQKFAGEVHKKWNLPLPSSPCSPVPILPPNTGMQGKSSLRGAAGLAGAHWAYVTKHQGLKDSQAGQVSSML